MSLVSVHGPATFGTAIFAAPVEMYDPLTLTLTAPWPASPTTWDMGDGGGTTDVTDATDGTTPYTFPNFGSYTVTATRTADGKAVSQVVTVGRPNQFARRLDTCAIVSSLWKTATTPANEVQTLGHTGTLTAGNFTLTIAGFTTGNIAYNASAATIKTAILTATGWNTNDVTTSGGPINTSDVVVTFTNNRARNYATMTVGGSVTGGTVTVTPTQDGVDAVGTDMARLTAQNGTLEFGTNVTTPSLYGDFVLVSSTGFTGITHAAAETAFAASAANSNFTNARLAWAIYKGTGTTTNPASWFWAPVTPGNQSRPFAAA